MENATLAVILTMNENAMPETKKRVTSISKAQTLEEIANFWDTHSLADYADQIREVEIEVRLDHRGDNAQITSSLRDGDLAKRSKQSPRKSRGLLPGTAARQGKCRGKHSQ
jgi:hypothetical protein